MNLRLHIEHLVLDGFDLTSAQAERLRRALGEELSRLLVQGGGIGTGGGVQPAGAPTLAWTPGASPERLAAGLARAVYPSLRGGAAEPAGAPPSNLRSPKAGASR